MATICYGVKITTTQTDLTDFDLGLVNGVIQWVTGRPGIDGWKEGILAEDSLGQVAQAIEISEGGGYGTMSGFRLSIRNNNQLAFTIRSLGLNLIQADIALYTFRDGVSTQDWSGKVADASFDQNLTTIDAMDSFRGIHKPLLKRIFTTDEFSDLPDSLKGKPIPVSIGRASKSQLFPVVQQEVLDTICTSGGVDFDIAPFTNYTDGDTGQNAYKIVHLKTVDKAFTLNELQGKFLTAIKGGDESVRITGNAASSGGITQVYIEKPFTTAPTTDNYWTATGADVWYFQISSLSIRYMASQNAVYAFGQNDDGLTSLYRYDTDLKEWEDVSDLVSASSLTNISSIGYPGLTVFSKPLDLDGNSLYYTFAVPSSMVELAETTSNAGAVTGTRPAPNAGTELTNLKDKNNGSLYTWIATSGGGPASLTIPFRITIPEKFLTSSLSNIYFAFNHSATFDNAPTLSIFFNVKLTDFLGRTTAALDTANRHLFGANILLAYYPLDLIPWKYFDSTSAQGNVQFENAKPYMKINESDHITKARDLDAYPYVICELKFQWTTGGLASEMTLEITEATLVGEKSLNLLSDTLYSDIIGDKFGTTWGSRKTAANAVENIAEATELLIRVYDDAAASIDTASFDVLGDVSTGTRKDWKIGRQIPEEKNTSDLCEELARFGFFGIIPKADGTRAAKAWLAGAPIATHDASVILEGSLGNREPTPLSNLYNAPQVNYAYNPGADKFDLFLQITKIDEDAFPAEATLDGNGNALWKSYAIGYNDDEYTQAKTNWDLCHLSWEKYGVIQTLPDDMANAYWFPDAEGVWGLAASQNAAKLYMDALCQWTPFRKDVVTYRLPNTATHAALELLDRVTFNDVRLTNGEDEVGTIIRRAINPGNGKDREDSIEISLMLDPVTE